MTVNPVAASAYTFGAAAPAETAAATGPNELDQDAFLQLLIASLKYQDPSEPMSTGELMQQTTQLSMMQALSDMTALAKDQFQLQVTSSAIALVGKQISYVGADGATATGFAESVSLVGGAPVIRVNGTEVPISSLVSVGASPGAEAPSAEPAAAEGAGAEGGASSGSPASAAATATSERPSVPTPSSSGGTAATSGGSAATTDQTA